MNKNELIKAVEQWFYDRGLHEADPEKQYLKLIEEVGELASGIARSDDDLIKDSIGDIAVVIIGLCTQTGIDGTDVFDISGKPRVIPEFDVGLIVSILEAIANSFYRLPYVEAASKSLDLGTPSQKRFFEEKLLFIVVKLNIIALSLNLDLIDCLHSAYNEIKDRKGKMVGGVFVKEEDL